MSCRRKHRSQIGGEGVAVLGSVEDHREGIQIGRGLGPSGAGVSCVQAVSVMMVHRAEHCIEPMIDVRSYCSLRVMDRAHCQRYCCLPSLVSH